VTPRLALTPRFGAWAKVYSTGETTVVTPPSARSAAGSRTPPKRSSATWRCANDRA